MVPSASSSQTIRKKDGEKKKVRKKDRKYTQREGGEEKKENEHETESGSATRVRSDAA